MLDAEVREPLITYAPPPPGTPVALPAANAPPPADAPPHVPGDTTPTWELELLVSGAVLFGLFQVPPLVLAAYERYLPHFGAVGVGVSSSLALLVLSTFYLLIGCFVLHLVLRAYWVALVGVQSVFPGGVRWDKQREYGPLQAELARQRVRPLPPLIARADNVASMVFATGFALSTSALVSIGFIAIIAVLLAASVAAFGIERGLVVAMAVYFVALVPMAAAPMIDLKYGARIDPDGRLARALRAVLRVVASPVPVGVRSLTSVLTSNVNKRVATSVAAVAFLGALATAAPQVYQDGDVLPSLGLRFFADEAPGASMPALRYTTLRGDAPASDRAPSIDTDVATGPYLRLFVPYRTTRHEEALARECPGLAPLDADDPYTPAARAAAAAVLQCAARGHRVTLDGQLLGALRFRFLADPRTNRRGFLAYVPVGALAAGEHLLTVAPARRARGAPLPPYEILFWK